jgi:signal transduction histidine kinase
LSYEGNGTTTVLGHFATYSTVFIKEGLNEYDMDGRLMDIILREINRLNNLVNDFLLFARPKPSGMREFDLKLLIDLNAPGINLSLLIIISKLYIADGAYEVEDTKLDVLFFCELIEGFKEIVSCFETADKGAANIRSNMHEIIIQHCL